MRLPAHGPLPYTLAMMTTHSSECRGTRWGRESIHMTHRRDRVLSKQLRMRPCVYGVLTLSCIVSACIPSTPQNTKGDSIAITIATPEELVAEWMQLAADPVTNAANPRAHELVGRLSTSGAEALMPIVEVLADSEADPHKKVFVVQCLAAHMAPAYAARLGELAKAPGEGTTRASAVTLLGFIPDPTIDLELRRYVDDPERRVSFSAKLGLARRGDAPMHAALVEEYALPDTSHQEQEQILGLILDDPQAENLPLLTRAVAATKTDPAQRAIIAAVLGRSGDAHAIDALRISLEVTRDPMYEGIARAAIDAIQERGNASPIDNR